MLQRPLDNGPPVVTVVDFSQAITDASAMELDADREAQLDFFLSVVCPPAAPPSSSVRTPPCSALGNAATPVKTGLTVTPHMTCALACGQRGAVECAASSPCAYAAGCGPRDPPPAHVAVVSSAGRRLHMLSAG